MYRKTHQQPQSTLKRLHERVQCTARDFLEKHTSQPVRDTHPASWGWRHNSSAASDCIYDRAPNLGAVPKKKKCLRNWPFSRESWDLDIWRVWRTQCTGLARCLSSAGQQSCQPGPPGALPSCHSTLSCCCCSPGAPSTWLSGDCQLTGFKYRKVLSKVDSIDGNISWSKLFLSENCVATLSLQKQSCVIRIYLHSRDKWKCSKKLRNYHQ